MSEPRFNSRALPGFADVDALIPVENVALRTAVELLVMQAYAAAQAIRDTPATPVSQNATNHSANTDYNT